MLEGVEFSCGRIILSQLKEVRQIAVFVCSIGDKMETWANQLLAENDFLEGYLADAIASEMVESATDQIQEKLSAEMKSSGLQITNRFSPGYCGWQVAEQHKLFGFLPQGFCGVSLTESALMRPIKSVSGIIGIGEKVKRRDYPCKVCNMKDCIYRRQK